jgi:methyltransferase (TIGR00027 family)
MAAATLRDAHRTYDAPPWVLDDAYALVFVGPAWRDIRAAHLATYSERARAQMRAGVAVRSRYAEDRLLSGAARQYVVLGAGLDSFAWRRPDVLKTSQLFEVDHPATQALKRQRIETLGLPVQERHVFAPVDFEQETLRDGLSRAGLDWGVPTFFSWLGVTPYLTHEAIEATLCTVASCASGSEVVFTYAPTDRFLDEIGREILEVFSKMAAEAGEPLTTYFTPDDIEAFVVRCGLEVADHPTRDRLAERYFSNRGDGLLPYTTERVLAARVPVA